MNQTIEKLIYRAGIIYGEDNVVNATAADLKKFAELLVKECAKFLEVNSGYDDCNNAWFPEPEDLLQHFGVDNNES
jgi:hypothetical protein